MKKNRQLTASAIIVAAGKGTRMNLEQNKQYIDIGDIPVLARTIRAFEDCEAIEEIVLVVNEEDILFCKQEIVDLCEFTKVKCIVAGGRERQESVYNGLGEVDGDCGVVLVHDGARPFIGEEDICACIDAAWQYDAACVAVPVKDTIKIADGDGFIVNTPERSLLWAMQTPQGFKYDLIMEAHKKAREEEFTGTDDAVLAERAGAKVKLVKGSYFNIKITTQEDLILAESIAEFHES